MHRGIYSYDKSLAATDGLTTVGNAQGKKREQELAAKAVPQWIKAAPRAAARSYVSRLNHLLATEARGGGEKKSATSLLFNLTPVELSVTIPTPLSGFTITQLQFPKGSVVVIRRLSAEQKVLEHSPQAKLSAGDSLVLRGTPHAVATVAALQGGRAVLLKPKESMAMRVLLKDERESLALAAQELHDRLLPRLRRAQIRWHRENEQAKAAARIQSIARGRRSRIKCGKSLDGLRRLRLSGRLAARRYIAEVVRRYYEGPILNRRMLKRLAEPSSPVLVLSEGDADSEQAPNIYAAIAARRHRVAQSHKAVLNRLLALAPEAEAIGVPMSVLALASGGPIAVTARLLINECKVRDLRCPSDVVVTHAKINKIRKPIKGMRGLDPEQKLLKGDELTLRALPHRLVLLTAAKNGVLALALPSKAANDDAEALAQGRELLLSVAEKLALWLQKAVRLRVAQRACARRAHAALVIQLAFTGFMMRKRSKSQGDPSPRKGKRPSDAPPDRVSAKPSGPAYSVDGAWKALKTRHTVAAKLGHKVKQKKRPGKVTNGNAAKKSGTSRMASGSKGHTVRV